MTDVPAHEFASVLVIAADRNIEALAGELVAFAGHRPLFDVTIGAGGESVRRHRPDVALMDTALPEAVFRACVGAADETGARVVLMSSTESGYELARHAVAERCLHFVLPGGPRQLGAVLEIALDRAPSRSTDTSRSLHDMPAVGSVHPALCAAIANVARARILSARAHTAVVDAQVLRTARRDVIEETQRSRAALRAAIADFAKQLRAGAVAEEEAVLQVQDAVADCASIMGARSDVAALLEDSEVWVRAAYRAA